MDFFFLSLLSKSTLWSYKSPHLRGFPVKNEHFANGSIILGSTAGEESDFIKLHEGEFIAIPSI